MFVRYLALAVVVLSIVAMWVWWAKRSELSEARKAAMPQCVARLGSEGDCEERFDAHHRECFTLTNRPATKTSGRSFDSKGYLECVLEGPEPWAEARRAERARAARERGRR